MVPDSRTVVVQSWLTSNFSIFHMRCKTLYQPLFNKQDYLYNKLASKRLRFGLGVGYLGGSMEGRRLPLFLLMIVAGVVGLKVTS